jgi:hypothetical protein
MTCMFLRMFARTNNLAFNLLRYELIVYSALEVNMNYNRILFSYIHLLF